MHIITDKTNVLVNYGTLKEYWRNGYPVITDAQGYDIAYPINSINIYEISEVPSEVETEKYCYTPEAGFYINENYVEPNPYGIPDELVAQIKNDAITEVEEAVLNGTY